MSKPSSILIDGTFWSVPSQFYQLLTFKAHIFGSFYPCIHILLTDKKQSTYIAAFEELKKLIKIEPECFVIDFELALLNAVRTCFPSPVFGCTFHFGRSLFRYIQKFKLTCLVKQNAEFKKYFKLLYEY